MIVLLIVFVVLAVTAYFVFTYMSRLRGARIVNYAGEVEAVIMYHVFVPKEQMSRLDKILAGFNARKYDISGDPSIPTYDQVQRKIEELKYDEEMDKGTNASKNVLNKTELDRFKKMAKYYLQILGPANPDNVPFCVILSETGKNSSEAVAKLRQSTELFKVRLSRARFIFFQISDESKMDDCLARG